MNYSVSSSYRVFINTATIIGTVIINPITILPKVFVQTIKLITINISANNTILRFSLIVNPRFSSQAVIIFPKYKLFRSQ